MMLIWLEVDVALTEPRKPTIRQPKIMAYDLSLGIHHALIPHLRSVLTSVNGVGRNVPVPRTHVELACHSDVRPD